MKQLRASSSITVSLFKSRLVTLSLLVLILVNSACSSSNTDAPLPAKPVKIDEDQLEQILGSNLNKAVSQQNRKILQSIEYQSRQMEQRHSQLLQQLQSNQVPMGEQTASNTNSEFNSVAVSKPNKPIMGELEHVYLAQLQASFIARISTGRKLSSLAVHNLILFKRNGEQWARFDVYLRGPQAPAQSFESKIERFEQIESESWSKHAEQSKRVAVIYSLFKVGEHSRKAELILSPLEQSTPLIIGRDFVSGFAIIDPQIQYNLGRVSP